MRILDIIKKKLSISFIIIQILIQILITKYLFCNEEIVFTYNDSIFFYDINTKLLKKHIENKKQTKNIFLKDFFINENGYFFLEIENNNLNVLTFKSKTKDLQKIFSGNYSNIYITSKYFVTFSKQLFNNKFEIEIFQYEYKNEKFKINKKNKLYLDLFISDFEIIGQKIILAGSSFDNKNNLLYSLDCQTNNITKIMEEPKNGDFFKIIQAQDKIIIYNSSKPLQEVENNIFIIDKKELKLLSRKTILNPIQKKSTSNRSENKTNKTIEQNTNENKINFYGKGFYYNENIYIPTIDSNNEIILLKTNKNLEIIDKIIFPTAIYKILGFYKNTLYFIGFNYYKDRSFYLCNYDFNNIEKLILK